MSQQARVVVADQSIRKGFERRGGAQGTDARQKVHGALPHSALSGPGQKRSANEGAIMRLARMSRT